MLGNLQSVFLPAKAKRFQKEYKKHAARLSTHQSQLLLSSFTLFNNRLLICRHFDINSDFFFTCLRHLDFLF